MTKRKKNLTSVEELDVLEKIIDARRGIACQKIDQTCDHETAQKPDQGRCKKRDEHFI